MAKAIKIFFISLFWCSKDVIFHASFLPWPTKLACHPCKMSSIVQERTPTRRAPRTINWTTIGIEYDLPTLHNSCKDSTHYQSHLWLLIICENFSLYHLPSKEANLGQHLWGPTVKMLQLLNTTSYNRILLRNCPF